MTPTCNTAKKRTSNAESRKLTLLDNAGIDYEVEHSKVIAYKSDIDFLNVSTANISQVEQWIRAEY